MTKKEIINALRHREESKWNRYVETKTLYGEDNACTVTQRSEWNETYRILSELGITTLGQERLKGFEKARRQSDREVQRIRQKA
jgi:hypothetical protein